MPKILVGSIFANAELASKYWLTLQLTALQNTVDYEHAIVLPPGGRAGDRRQAHIYYAKFTKVLPFKREDGRGYGSAHSAGATTILNYFKERQDEFDYFLFLDSDAFPIRRDWLNTLLKLMAHNEIAILYRPEFAETRLHSAVLFAKKPALSVLRFVHRLRGRRGGGAEKDTHVEPYTTHWRRTVRLVRSNRTNIHPMLAGVYADIFYHHGCGSRHNRNNFGDDFWAPLVPESHFEKFLPGRLQKELIANPREFLSRFLWDPSLCTLPDHLPNLED